MGQSQTGVHTVRMAAPLGHPLRTKSDRWAIGAAVVAGPGVLATLAGTIELGSNRHIPRGWTRYQPPWTAPVFVSGLALLTLALGFGLIAIASARRSSKERTAKT